MGKPDTIRIHWPEPLIDHFSHFFAEQWNAIITRTLTANGTSAGMSGYILTALQSTVDQSLHSAEQALLSGFSPSWHPQPPLKDPPTDQSQDKALAILLEIVTGIVNTDRRDYRNRTGPCSLGDHFFESIRRALRKGEIARCIGAHHQTASHFGDSAYYAMILSGIGAKKLHNYAENQLRYPLTADNLNELKDCCPNQGTREFSNLSVVASADAQAIDISECIFHDCEIGPGVFQRVSNAYFEACDLCSTAIQSCEQSTFRESHTFNAPTPSSAAVNYAQFDECLFYDTFFCAGNTPIVLRNCSFSDERINGLHISTLSGDYTETHFQNCVIDKISTNSLLGGISKSIIGGAQQAQFSGPLSSVRFNGDLEQCRFGAGHPLLIDNVVFSASEGPSLDEYLRSTDNGRQRATITQLHDCHFVKGVRFQNVSFECLLQDPVFDCGSLGINNIWHLQTGTSNRNAYQGIRFGRIETTGCASVAAIIGGSIAILSGSIEHLSHTIIGEIEAGGRVATYEVVLDPIMRQQWQAQASATLISTLNGEIDRVTFVGAGTQGFNIGRVSGRIKEFFPGLTIRELARGGRVIFPQQTDIDEVLDHNVIENFTGGQFGVRSINNDNQTSSINYYFDADDYRNRRRLDTVNDIFDNLA